MDWNQLPCYFAGPVGDDGLRPCFHPRLSGLKIVSRQQCTGCDYRHRLPADTLAPEHADCCSDDALAFLSPRMPAAMAAQMLRSGEGLRPDRWWTWPNVQAAFRLLIDESIDGIRPCPTHFQGRGIVIVGGGKYLPSAYVTLRVLRHVGCTLPVQLWHLDGEVDDHDRELFSQWDCECVDGEEHARNTGFEFHESWWRGWQLKSYAVAHSPFREVLYLDADCYPTRDPESLFDERVYRERGAIFWPDLENSSCLLPAGAPAIFGAPSLSDLPSESGQLLINKEHCWRELNLALFLNAQADYTYRLLWGDKDTFPIAWRRLGREYGRLWPKSGTTPQALLQYDGQGKVLFQHRASDKFRLPGTQFDSNRQRFAANQRNPGLAHEDFCFQVLAELQEAIEARAKPASEELPPQETVAAAASDLQPASIEQMYPPVPVSLLVSEAWQRRFREYFLDSGELPADPFEVAERSERPQRKCVSVCIFKQNVNNRFAGEFPIDETAWRSKYWCGLINLVQELRLLSEWKLRIYVENQLWPEAVREFSENAQVELYRMQVESIGQSPGSLWRFLALDDKSLELVLVTDIDEPLSTKLHHIRSFEMDETATLGRIGGFVSPRNYFVSPGESPAKNFATVIASCVMSRPAGFDFDVAAALRGFMAQRRQGSESNRPWAYSDSESPSAYNQPIGAHHLGWGSHWYMYCFDERFLKHVVYYHFAAKGEVHTWAPSWPPSRLNPEGLCDLQHVQSRDNVMVNPHTVTRVIPLNLSPAALRVSFVLDEHRWIFDSLLEIMRAHLGRGYCGNVCFHDMSDPECLALVPKQINLLQAATGAARALEIGFNAGHSAAIMLLANPYLTIRAFDACAFDYSGPCLDFLNSVFRNRISLVQGLSQVAVPADPLQGYDLLHIDADHTFGAVAGDLANCLPKCVSGATVIMDDYEAGNDVARATLERSDLVSSLLPLEAVLSGSSHAIFTYQPG